MISDQHSKEKNLIDKGRIYCNSGDLQKALTCLNEVIEGNPKSHEAFYIIGNTFHKNGEISKAIRAFSKALELEPEHTDAAIALSVLYNDIGRYEEGKAIFEKAHEQVRSSREIDTNSLVNSSHAVRRSGYPHINKKFSYKHYELAELYTSYGRYDEALFEYNKTIALDPSNLEARIKVGKVYAKKGFIAKSIDELKRLKREHPSYHPVRIALGLLYFSHDKVIEAQKEWRNILSLDPGNEDAKMYLKMSESATETRLS